MLVSLFLSLVFGILKLIIISPINIFVKLIKPAFQFGFSLGWIADIIQPALRVFAFLLDNDVLFNFLLGLTITLIPFEFAISLAWWVLYKVPILNLKNR